MVSLVHFKFEMTSQIISARGKLLAYFNHKKILLPTRSLFAIGSTLTAAAPSMNAFIVGKAITGIGSSGCYISIINIIAAFTTPVEKGRYFGYIGFVWGLGTMSVGYHYFIIISYQTDAEIRTLHWRRLCRHCRRLALEFLLQSKPCW